MELFQRFVSDMRWRRKTEIKQFHWQSAEMTQFFVQFYFGLADSLTDTSLATKDIQLRNGYTATILNKGME